MSLSQTLSSIKPFVLKWISASVTVSAATVSSPPTEAEITAAFGSPTTRRTCLLIGNSSTSTEYFCISDGTTWQILPLTKAV